MSNKIKIREYKKGDEQELVDLYNRCFNKKISMKYWMWKYLQNPYGKIILLAINEKGRIIGNYGMQKNSGEYLGKKIKIIHIVDLCLDEKYRHAKIFKKLVEGSLNKKFDMAWGFPKNYPFKAYIKYNLSDSPSKISIFSKKISIFSAFKLKFNKYDKIIKISEKNIEVLRDLWKEKKKELKISIERDPKYLKWRILNSPEKMHLLAIENGGEIVGYFAICKKNKIALIVDILVLNNFLNKGISQIEKVSSKMKCKEIRILVNDPEIKKILNKQGFKKEYEKNFSYFSKIGKNFKPEDMYITFADTDAI